MKHTYHADIETIDNYGSTPANKASLSDYLDVVIYIFMKNKMLEDLIAWLISKYYRRYLV